MTDPAEAERALAARHRSSAARTLGESRPDDGEGDRADGVLRVEIEAASLKARTGRPIDEDEDYELPIWGGVIPLRVVAGVPEADAECWKAWSCPHR